MQFVCNDVQREAITARERSASLDAGWNTADPDRPAPDRQVAEAFEQQDRGERSADAAAFLASAMPELLDSRRAVVERTLYGAELPEICAELSLSPGNAYQLRSRGFKDLAELKEQYDA